MLDPNSAPTARRIDTSAGDELLRAPANACRRQGDTGDERGRLQPPSDRLASDQESETEAQPAEHRPPGEGRSERTIEAPAKAAEHASIRR
jgi:hypothetical protein